MRIGLRVAARSSGGGRAFIEELAAALTAIPQVSAAPVFVLGGRRPTYDVPLEVPVPLPHDRFRSTLMATDRLTAAARRHPVDLLIAPGTETTQVPGTPTVMWPLTVAPFEESAVLALAQTPRERARWVALRWRITAAASRADAFAFSSHYARALYREQVRGVRHRPTTVIPPAPTLIPSPCRTGMSDTPYVLFVSHLYPYKMVVETVEAFAIARSRGIRHQLVIAGRPVHDSYHRQILRTIRRCHLDDAVVMRGNTSESELRLLYSQADLFIFPSLSENAGSYALIDAFRYGLPVISSGLSSMPEACQDAARYIDPRDPEHMANVMVDVLVDRSVRDELAGRSATRGREYLDWNDVAVRLVNFAEVLLAGSRDGTSP